MESAAPKRKIDPRVLLVLCAMVLSALTIWVVYSVTAEATREKQQRDHDRQVCELAAAMRGETLAYAEVLCAR